MTIKTFDELTFADDYMFCKVLENNEDLCKEMIELILDRKIRIVHSLNRQKAIEITPDGKGIRLDVCMEDDDTVYDLEMQNGHREELPRRSRYYQAVIDVDMMEKGAKYDTLKESCIIFICTFDPFGYGYNRYVVKPAIAEHPEFCYNDGTMKVFLSTRPELQGEMSEELRTFLDYVNGASAEGNLPRRIEDAVQRVKAQADWRKEYMFIEEKYREFLEEGREEGRKKGLEEGRKEGRKEGREEKELDTIRALMKNMNWAAEEAMDNMDIPKERQGVLIGRI